MICCGNEVETPFCPRCGKDIGGGNVEILREYIRKEHGSIKSAEKFLRRNPEWKAQSERIDKSNRRIEALEAAIAALIRISQ